MTIYVMRIYTLFFQSNFALKIEGIFLEVSNMIRTLFALLPFFVPLVVYGESSNNSQLLGIAQGISSPSSTSSINYSNGFTFENPVGIIYQKEIWVSALYDTGESSTSSNTTGYGAELGIGNGTYGVGVGYYKSCDACTESVTGALGIELGDFGIGFRFRNRVYSVGFLLSPNGTHRIGLLAEFQDPEGENNNLSALGVGYSLVSSQFTLSLDASKLDFENSALSDDVILVTPGIALRFDFLAVTVSYDLYVNDEANANRNDDLWWGIGIGRGESWHVAVYNDYVNKWSVVGTLFF